MLFTIFNNAVLYNAMGEFKYQTDEEDVDELDMQIEHYKKLGML